MAIIITAHKEAEKLLYRLKKNVRGLQKIPTLASLCVGENASSSKYILAQKSVAYRLGIEHKLFSFKKSVPLSTFKSFIEKLNRDSKISGIILNKPFPKEWPEFEIFSLVDKNKDVEGMHPQNLGKLFLDNNGKNEIISPTVLSIIALLDKGLKKLKISSLYGQRITLVGFSSLIGRILAIILGKKLATVSITHIATYRKGDLPHYIKNSQILITAVGKPNLIKGEWIRKGSLIIDAGVGLRKRQLQGDVEYKEALKKAAAITPALCGVGKLTTLFLYSNLVQLVKNEFRKETKKR